MWRKIGFIKLPHTQLSWMKSHCQLPTVQIIGNRSARVFFASRSEEQRSHIGFVDIRIDESNSIDVEEFSKTPVLAPGEIGHFDEHGVFPSCVVQERGKYYMFYIGWNQGVEAPLFYANIGLAISDDGKHFERFSKAPLLGRSEVDPCLVTSPFVLKGNDNWQMYYVSGIKWERISKTKKLQSFYHIKYAESEDLLSWNRQGEVAIDLNPGETNVARASVIRDPDAYKMWFSYVHSSIDKYRIGYATSKDGKCWVRRDEQAGISTDNSYASDMICYPQVFELSKSKYMLYNGNSFGVEGFGIAVWEEHQSKVKFDS